MAAKLDDVSDRDDTGRAEELAKEARQIAAALEAAQVDPAIIERQQRLFRKMLDAGRMLEEDEREDTGKREAKSWTGTDVFTPSVTHLESTGADAWQATLRFFLTEYAQVGFDLVDAAGTVRTPVSPPAWTAPGAIERTVRFTTRPEAGLRLRIEAVPTYSSRKVLRVDKRTGPLAFPAARP